MIQIYKKTNTNYDQNGDYTLQPTVCELQAVLNGEWELELRTPMVIGWRAVEEDAVIAAPTFMGEKQLFRISKVEKTDAEIIAIAYPIFFDSGKDAFIMDRRPTNQNGQGALDVMLNGTIYSGESDITTTSTAYFTRRNVMDALNGSDDPTFVKRWNAELLFDNYKVIANRHVGGDYGVTVRYGKNIDGVRYSVDMAEVVTRIIPVGYNGRMLSTTDKYVDSPLRDRYANIRAKEMKFEKIKLAEDAGTIDDTEDIICDTQADFDAALIAACNEQYAAGADLPAVTIEVNMLSLNDTEEYRDFAELGKVGLGDTVHCFHTRLGISTDARAVEIAWDCIQNKCTYVKLGDYTKNYFDSIASTIKAVGEIIGPNNTVMAEKISGVLNAVNTQLRYQKNVAQKTDVRAILFEDLDPDSFTYGAMCIGTQGFQIANSRTQDGRDWDWKTAFTAKGGYADVLVLGILSDRAGNNYWNLETGEFRLGGGTTLNVGNSTLADYISQRAAAEAESEVTNFITNTYTSDIAAIYDQLDSAIETWFYDYAPTLSNEPAVEWTTEEQKAEHEGDLFYDKSTGNSYRFFKNNGTWEWSILQNTEAARALAMAATAQDTADAKRRVFYSTPIPPYDPGDLWVQGEDGDILRCMTAKQSGGIYSESDWVLASKYTDDSSIINFVQNVYSVDKDLFQDKIDSKVETWYQATDPQLSWKAASSNPMLDSTGEPILDHNGQEFVLDLEVDKLAHEGDLWHRTTDNTEWIYKNGEWQAMDVPDSLFDAIDGKANVFTERPVPPYHVNDMWFDGTKILVCVQARAENEPFDASDWVKKDAYTDDTALSYFLNNTYSDDIAEIKDQVDSKAETFYQETDPSSSWSSPQVKNEHIGDMWFDTNSQRSFRWTGTAWEEMKTAPPDSVYDAIDGKAQIFVSTPYPPYEVGDLWFNSEGEILTCMTEKTTGQSYSANDWVKKNKYTDDTAAQAAAAELQVFLNNTYAYDINGLTEQIDGKVEVWYQRTDPSAAWTTTSAKSKHAGDIWYNSTPTVQKSYTWNGTIWQEMTSTPPSAILDKIDGKCQVFLNKPVPPYSVGDIWFNADSGKILVCVYTRATGNYQAADWMKKDTYADQKDLSDLSAALVSMQTDLQSQIDGRIQTFAQEADPAANWTTQEKAKHTGDIWYNTSSKVTYRYSGSQWVKLENADATGAATLAQKKCQVWTSSPVPPYNKGDLWVTSLVNGQSEIKTCKQTRSSGAFVSTDWISPKYIDANVLNTAIESYDNSLGQDEVFNRLTKNGTEELLQKDENGHLYGNATYILAGTLAGERINARGLHVLDNQNRTTFYINDSGEVEMNAKQLSIKGKDFEDYLDENNNLLDNPRDLTNSSSWIWMGTLMGGQADPDGGTNAVKMKRTSAAGDEANFSSSASNLPFKSGGQTYKFSVWLKAEEATTVKIIMNHAITHDVALSTEWKRFTVEDYVETPASSYHVTIGAWHSWVTTKNIYIYDPVVEYADPYMDQQTIFNQLTNNGQEQGLYLQNGRLYLNGTYVKAGKVTGDHVDAKGMTVKDGNNNTTFEVTSDGKVNIRATSLSISGQAAATTDNVNAALKNAKAYSNDNLKAAESYADGTLASAKTYTDTSLAAAKAYADEHGNLLKDPFDLTSDYWEYGYGTRTAGQIDPNGGNKAIRIRASGSDSYCASKVSTNKPLSSTGQTYRFSVWLKSNTTRTIYLALNNTYNQKEISVSYTWKRYTIEAKVDTITSLQHVVIGGWGSFTSGDLYIYNPVVEFTDPYIDQLAIMDRLTGGSRNQGIYLENGKIYINGEYINSLLITAAMIRSQDLYSIQATIGGFKINATSIYSEDNYGSATYKTLQLMKEEYTEGGSPFHRGALQLRDLNGTRVMMMSGGIIRNISQSARLSIDAAAGLYSDIVDSGAYNQFGTSRINGDNTVVGNFKVGGTKSAVRPTKDYGEQTYYSYEMPSPYFGDIGDGRLDENGVCYVSIDDIFTESTNMSLQYYVFLQKCGEGDCWVAERTPEYFVVRGTPGMAFTWEVKGKQTGYENIRFNDEAAKAREVDFIVEDYEQTSAVMVEDTMREEEETYEEIDEFY